MSTAYGNKIHSRWRAILSYTVTTNATSVVVRCKSGFQFINNANYDGSAARYSIINGTKVQPSGSWTVASNGTKYINPSSGTRTITYERGTTSTTKTISFSSYIAGSYAPGTSSGSVSISVPALQSWTLQFDSNGGTGTVANKTKFYNTALTLPASGFTKVGYRQIGWSTNSSATTAEYAMGGTYPAASAGGTLYAVWEAVLLPPSITEFVASRYLNGQEDDEGTSCHINLTYTGATIAEVPQGITCYIYVYDADSERPLSPQHTHILNSAGGSYSATISGTYDVNTNWAVDCFVLVQDDDTIYAVKSDTLPTAKFPIDVLADGSAVGIMMPAQEGTDVSLPLNTRVGGVPVAELFSSIFETAYEIPVSVANGTFTSNGCVAMLIGNILRLYISCNANSAITAGNITNQTMITITVNSDKIKDIYSISTTGGSSGPNSQIYYACDHHTVRLELAAIAQNIARGGTINGYVGLPCTLNLDAY